MLWSIAITPHLILLDNEMIIMSSRLLSKNVKVKVHKAIILPVVLYGCKTWSLALKEEHRLRVFEKRVLRKIFGPKRDKVTKEWRKLHSEEFLILYSSTSVIRQIKLRRMRRVGHVPCMGKARKCTGFWRESQKERDHSENRGVDGRMG
jgi:hypothetical protein